MVHSTEASKVNSNLMNNYKRASINEHKLYSAGGISRAYSNIIHDKLLFYYYSTIENISLINVQSIIMCFLNSGTSLISNILHE